jgi:hypothetical protein
MDVHARSFLGFSRFHLKDGLHLIISRTAIRVLLGTAFYPWPWQFFTPAKKIVLSRIGKWTVADICDCQKRAGRAASLICVRPCINHVLINLGSKNRGSDRISSVWKAFRDRKRWDDSSERRCSRWGEGAGHRRWSGWRGRVEAPEQYARQATLPKVMRWALTLSRGSQ